MKDQRQKPDRRDDERRRADRRTKSRRTHQRRYGHRRKDFCPTCGGTLTATAYCRSCRVRVVKIRTNR